MLFAAHGSIKHEQRVAGSVHEGADVISDAGGLVAADEVCVRSQSLDLVTLAALQATRPLVLQLGVLAITELLSVDTGRRVRRS